MMTSRPKHSHLLSVLLAMLVVTALGVGSAGAQTGIFIDSGQALGSLRSSDVSLGDLDGDGDLDAFVANGLHNFTEPNKVWLNDGSGTFTDTGQSLGNRSSHSVRLGDLDDDGDLDAFVANHFNQPNTVWLNDGGGTFTDSGQLLGSFNSMHLALGDVDDDKDLDAFVANGDGLANQPNKVWLNNGNGIFSSSLSVGFSMSDGVGLGDLDDDDDLDAFVANRGQEPANPQGNRVWLNDGSGNFTDTGQSLGSSFSLGVALGDVDGDSDFDAFVVNKSSQPDTVWLNDGSGNFTDSGQSLATDPGRRVALGDLDGDGDLDAFVAVADVGPSDRVWLNDGSGTFSLHQSLVGPANSKGVGLGDLDGDGDLDAFVVGNGYPAPGEPNKVWLNQSVTVKTVAIDIKPGSFPNSINPKSKGKIPVAILGNEIDVTTIDQTTVRFGATGTEATPAKTNVKPSDVDGDGIPDLVLHFPTQATGFQAGDTVGILTGQTLSATPVQGSDSIVIVPPAAPVAVAFPRETRLLAAFPNPNNPEVWIPYHLGSESHVVIRIYDVTGHLVRELDLGHQAAGFYDSKAKAAYWNGHNHRGERVASGVYFYTFQAHDFTATRKLMITR